MLAFAGSNAINIRISLGLINLMAYKRRAWNLSRRLDVGENDDLVPRTTSSSLGADNWRDTLTDDATDIQSDGQNTQKLAERSSAYNSFTNTENWQLSTFDDHDKDQKVVYYPFTVVSGNAKTIQGDVIHETHHHHYEAPSKSSNSDLSHADAQLVLAKMQEFANVFKAQMPQAPIRLEPGYVTHWAQNVYVKSLEAMSEDNSCRNSQASSVNAHAGSTRSLRISDTSSVMTVLDAMIMERVSSMQFEQRPKSLGRPYAVNLTNNRQSLLHVSSYLPSIERLGREELLRKIPSFEGKNMVNKLKDRFVTHKSSRSLIGTSISYPQLVSTSVLRDDLDINPSSAIHGHENSTATESSPPVEIRAQTPNTALHSAHAFDAESVSLQQESIQHEPIMDLPGLPLHAEVASNSSARDKSLIIIQQAIDEAADVAPYSFWPLSVDASRKGLKDLSQEATVLLRAAERLALSFNQLTDLPSNFGGCYRLRYLNLRSNKLSQIPEVLFSMDSLEILDISKNKIETISPRIQNMHSLRILAFKSNNIRELPVEIADLKCIVRILIKDNPLIPFLSPIADGTENHRIKAVSETERDNIMTVRILDYLSLLKYGETRRPTTPSHNIPKFSNSPRAVIKADPDPAFSSPLVGFD